MFVSVIVPLYNKKDYVVRALDSIAAQTYENFEVIIVNDGSSDGGDLLAEAYPDKRFRTVSQPNRGPGAARNRGLLEARGELAAFLDADDEWLPTFLQTNIKLLQQLGAEVACITCGYRECPGEISTEPMWRRRGLRDGVQRIEKTREGALRLHYMLAFMSPCSTIARIRVLRKFGGFFASDRCTFGEDATIFLKVLLNEKVYFHSTPLVTFHREASGLSNSQSHIRQIEPFLSNPAEVGSVCPDELRPAFEQLLAIRACKAAAMLGYWGKWREARSLFGKFTRSAQWQLPFFAYGLAGCTPIAGCLGKIARCSKKLLRRA